MSKNYFTCPKCNNNKIEEVLINWSAPVCCASCYESISHTFSLS
jgi:hypothetical protein